MSLSHSPSIITNGLVLCLDAGNRRSYPGSGNTWYDLSGNNRNANLLGGVSYNFDNYGGLILDGTDDYIELTNMSSLQLLTSPSITLDIWVKANAFSARTYIFENRTVSLNNIFAIFTDAANSTTATLRTHFASAGDITIQSISTNIIYNLVYVINTSSITDNVQFYVNKTKRIYSYNFNESVNTSNNMYLGKAYVANGYRWNGSMYRFSYYNRVLSESEIKQNYNAIRGRFGL